MLLSPTKIMRIIDELMMMSFFSHHIQVIHRVSQYTYFNSGPVVWGKKLYNKQNKKTKKQKNKKTKKQKNKKTKKGKRIKFHNFRKQPK